jgi:hypothetical protein
MRRRAAWMQLLETAPDEVRRTLTIDLPEPPGAGP